MLFKYISKPACIFLAVTPANTDLVNSGSLKMAPGADLEGTRTIGVPTKLACGEYQFCSATLRTTLIPKILGMDVVGILARRVIPLRLNSVPVVNLGQRGIDTSKSIQQALDAERNFFEHHPAYRGKAQTF